jgi:hypothetical protein
MVSKLIWTDEDKFFITTFNKRLYDDYAHKFLQTYAETNQTIKMICYVEEDYQYPNYKGITYVNLPQEMPELVAFKERHKDKIWHDDSDFLQNAVRFSHKVFAQYHASKLGKKFMWLDADNIFMKQFPDNYMDTFIPDDTFTTFYGRDHYTECGVVGFNCTLNISKKFFDTYLSHYTKDTIYNLPNKTDCHAFDNTRKLVQVKERNKNDGHGGHIIARDKEINPYIDHKKGKRKYKDNSPEWVRQTNESR